MVSQGADGFIIFRVEVVAVGEDGADGCDGLDVHLRGGGLEDDAAGVAPVAEQAHAVEGDEGVFGVGAVIGGVLDFELEDADDLEDMALNADRFAYGRVAVEEFACSVGTEDDDLAMLRVVGCLEEAALRDVQLAHGAVGQVDCFALDVDDLGAILEAEGVVGLSADGFEEGDGLADGFNVAIEKLDAFAGAFATYLHAGLAAPDHDDVIADAQEAVEDAGAYASAVAEEQDDGDESPDNADHSETGAQPVAQERRDALADDLGELHRYSVLRHSMGLRLAARSAG